MRASRSTWTPRPARFRTETRASVHHRGANYPCAVRNLSHTGVLLEGRIPPLDDAVAEFSLLTPAGDLEARLRGRIVRRTVVDGRDDVLVAIEFVDLDPDRRDALETVLARVIEHPPSSGTGLDAIRPGMPPNEIRKVLDGVPLPERIALAARAKVSEREFLRHDVHPAVLGSLFRNPGISANEIAALLPSPAVGPSMLEALSRDARWTRELDLTISIITHPRTPPPVAERLLDELPTPALRKVMKQSTIVPALRSKIIRRLAGG